ncbi:MAG TPA: hypothetical protein VMT27_00825, partial [Actinomycetes bacterium]|nr:hypothetical protein [Actinomycetes bacterium]
MNLTEVTVERAGDGVQLMLEGQPLPAPRDAHLANYVGGPVIVGVRPSDLAEPIDGHHSGWPTVNVVVDVVEELGTEANVLFRLASPDGGVVGHDTSLVSATAVFTATVDARTRLRAGDRTRLAVDQRRLHLFDTVTGQAIRRSR